MCGLLFLRPVWAAQDCAPFMWAVCLYGCCSLVWGRLLEQLLLLEWGWAAHCTAVPYTVLGCSHSCCSVDSGWAACVAAAPWEGVSCTCGCSLACCGPLIQLLLVGPVPASCGCSSLDQYGLCRLAASWTWMGCSGGCFSLNSCGLLTPLLLLGRGNGPLIQLILLGQEQAT